MTWYGSSQLASRVQLFCLWLPTVLCRELNPLIERCTHGHADYSTKRFIANMWQDGEQLGV